MSTLTRTLALRGIVESDSTWRLLRADNVPVIAAVLDEHLGGETRRLPSAELYELIDHDLEELRAHGIELPQRAQGYCAEWRKAGFLTRRATEESRGETFELAPGALGAIRILEQLVAPQSRVTESRLSSIAAQLDRLAVDTDPDVSRRLERLHAQRDQLDAEIERVHSGELSALDPAKALERMRDILAQAEEIPTEFARVRERFEALNRDLRASIVESTESQRSVLDDVFRGVDLIAESDEGRSFAGFSTLVLDPTLGSAFDDDIARVIDRRFADDLSPAQRSFLRRFIRTLKDNSSEIHDVITSFARGLRRYVQSQDYQRDRVLRGMLRESLASAVAASETTKPYRLTSLHLELSGVTLGSVGSVKLHDPSDLDATAPITEHADDVADLDALRALARETEIDFAELTSHVNAVLAELERCSVGEVLDRYPASQGVASVVGLLALAAEQGTRATASASDAEPLDWEIVRWQGTDEVARAARIPVHLFTGRIV